MIIINSVAINTPQELEVAIDGMDDASKLHLSNLFYGVDNVPIYPKALRIYALLDYSGNVSEPPLEVDYITGLKTKLHRKQTMLRGEVQQELFYKNFDGTTYSNLVVKELHTYVRDSFGFCKSRITTVSWIYEDDTECTIKKTWTKYYDNLQMIEEGIQRRSNIVKSLQPKVLGLLQMTMSASEQPNIIPYGRAFLSAMKDSFENFTNHSDRSLYTDLQAPAITNQFPWLSNVIPNTGGITILQFIISEVTIA
jgi:hypothetical protein